MNDDEARRRRIQAALDDFWAMLASVPVVGVSQCAEVEQLTRLIQRHPDTARRILDGLRSTDDSPQRSALFSQGSDRVAG